MARPPGPARVVTVVVVLAAILADPAGSVLAAGRPAVATGPPTVAAAAPAVAGSGVVAPPRVKARAAVLADESTGQVLFERNATAASTTTTITARRRRAGRAGLPWAVI